MASEADAGAGRSRSRSRNRARGDADDGAGPDHAPAAWEWAEIAQFVPSFCHPGDMAAGLNRRGARDARCRWRDFQAGDTYGD